MTWPWDPVVDLAQDAGRWVGEQAADVFDIGEASGNAGGSGDWDAWGHPELYAMVQETVDPADIEEAAAGWRQIGTDVTDSLAGTLGELDGIIAGGWRGGSADAAAGAIGPVRDWSQQLSDAVTQTSELMGNSGQSAEQAKRDVPPPVEFDVARSLRSSGAGWLLGPVGALGGAGIDAVLQDRARDEAKAQAVQVMSTAYTPPLVESQTAVPAYPQLRDPTANPGEVPPNPGDPPPVPAGGSGGVDGGGGGAAAGGAVTGGQQGYQPYQSPGGVTAPAAAAAPAETSGQGVGGRPGPGGGSSGPQGPGGGGAAGGGVPGMAPAAFGGGAGGGADRSRAGGRLGGGAGGGSRGGGGAGGFGPRGSGAGGSGQRPSWAAGGPGGQGAGAAGRAGAGSAGRGGMPMGGMAAGAGRGQGGEDSEHQRKYLIEADPDAIVGQIDAVAPPVLGEDPDVYQRGDDR